MSFGDKIIYIKTIGFKKDYIFNFQGIVGRIIIVISIKDIIHVHFIWLLRKYLKNGIS
jgi:hypothetical protein